MSLESSNKARKLACLGATLACVLLTAICSAQGAKDKLSPLPSGNIKLQGYFENDIQNSIDHWIKGVMPYDSVTNFFYNGRKQFALGEMPGKALRTNSLMYRYTRDPEIKDISRKVVYSLIGATRSNGSISCTPVEAQPGDRDGDLWERKYVLLGLSQYYLDVEPEPRILQAMEAQMRSIMDQVGPAPKKGVTTLGWSANKIESSSLLEPVMRLYNLTGRTAYLDFAEYIIAEGGAAGKNIFEQVRAGVPMREVGVPYPKAYEMTSVWEGLAEYYRTTGDPSVLDILTKYFNAVAEEEITIIGNAGADVYWPNLMGEGWGNTAVEQSNPDVKRMMETCVGVTWMKYCSQYLRLTGDPRAVDYIEKYIYNGLIGAMRPDGTGFSYVNLLNGAKVTNHGWGWNFGGLPVTCCNLNGPTGLAYIPYVAVMQGASGPVVNLYNAFEAKAKSPTGRDIALKLTGEFPRGNEVFINVSPVAIEKFDLKLRIPSWSPNTWVEVNGEQVKGVASGEYLTISRTWKRDDVVRIIFDFRAKVLQSQSGKNPKSGDYTALQWGPIVLSRDEDIDPAYDQPVEFDAKGGEVKVVQVTPQRYGTRMEFIVPTKAGDIHMVDYSSVDCWDGSHIQTWLPKVK